MTCIHPTDSASAEPTALTDAATRSLWIVGVTWLLVAAAGSLWMARYSQLAGAAGTAPQHWPSASQVPRDPDVSTLLMFVHPRCPCSRASIGELEKVMAHCRGRVSAQVLFLQPEGGGEEWAKTDLWHSAKAIPGVSVSMDHDGNEARLFKAATSGQTLLYDAQGGLRYEGGITLARGHAGDNPGRDAIECLLKQKHTRPASMPVFGCGLGLKNQEECTACKP